MSQSSSHRWENVSGPVIAVVSAVRTGRVQTHTWGGREISSGAVKQPRDEPVMLRRLGFDGDEQADTRFHGGPDKAALFYAAHHHPKWASDEGLDMPEGAFFENLTLADPPGGTGPDETTSVLGEVWRVGDAVVQITQSRSPCYKLARRWGVKDLALRVQRTGWTGWYARVLVEGEIGAGDTVERLDVPDSAPTLAEVSRVMNVDKDDLEAARRLVDAPDLPDRWRVQLRERLEGTVRDDTARLTGDGV